MKRVLLFLPVVVDEVDVPDDQLFIRLRSPLPTSVVSTIWPGTFVIWIVSSVILMKTLLIFPSWTIYPRKLRWKPKIVSGRWIFPLR